MKITYIGHACFKVEDKGYTLVIDPYSDGSVPGLKDVREVANEVIFTHDHHDHMSEGTVEIVPGGERPFKITKIVSYHDDAQGSKRGLNCIILLEGTDPFDPDKKVRVAHLGDVGCQLDADQLNSLKDLDVALIPVGGVYTIDARGAIEMTETLGARMTVPMHYRSPEGEWGLPELGTVYDYAAFIRNVMITSVSTLDTNEMFKNSIIVLQAKNQIKDMTRPRIV